MHAEQSAGVLAQSLARPRARWSGSTGGPRVIVRVGPRASAAFTVFSVSGRISNELSRATSRPSTGQGRELAFSAGDGTARVTVRTFDGPVALRER